ncbi:FKBP-type peptidyl-prolyl cis-trans isomerase [Lysobacter sp. MMG2]|uniref:FKBP-type peptidyl-prolyl cis-trans isomerase n=1 Tax=Lysobacter sp. MMG2 TaxID=2801338 RepID=UPI001C22F065|nr:FKBP-type peptidyl-prolyl cis-trans isomerase [Lysobacter sp. MMG2]MBU8974693.1 FKBP-type peptidyl-prolyl cis-trans isomerase [Lysobacter sp. MMG2]
MKFTPRHTGLVLAVASLAALTAACNKPADKADAAKTDAAAAQAGKDGAKAIPGLATEKEQVSYMIGMDMARSLEQVKDEIDLDTLNKALKASLAGEKPLLDEKQAGEIREAFAKKLQQKRMDKMIADAKTNLEDGEKFLAENSKKPGVVTTASGLQYQVITEGKGPKPTVNDVVTAHYKGTLLDGKTFDSSYDRGEPANFPLSQMVPGWQEGIPLMPVGSKYRFWIPSKLAYGEQGAGPIGPNATIVFEVELLDIVKPGAGK